MSATLLRLRTAFEPESRFDLAFETGVPFRATTETEFETLQKRLVLESLEDQSDPAVNALVRRAANKAATIAELTGYPLLVFPSLFEEIATRLTHIYKKARRSSPMLVEAA